MYIHPFICGVVFTLLAELFLSAMCVVVKKRK